MKTRHVRLCISCLLVALLSSCKSVPVPTPDQGYALVVPQQGKFWAAEGFVVLNDPRTDEMSRELRAERLPVPPDFRMDGRQLIAWKPGWVKGPLGQFPAGTHRIRVAFWPNPAVGAQVPVEFNFLMESGRRYLVSCEVVEHGRFDMTLTYAVTEEKSGKVVASKTVEHHGLWSPCAVPWR